MYTVQYHSSSQNITNHYETELHNQASEKGGGRGGGGIVVGDGYRIVK